MSDDENSHLSNLSDGAGCTEIWEHLSEQRAADDAERDAEAESDAEESTEDVPEKDAAGVPCP